MTSWLRRRLGAARSFQKSHVRVVEGDEIIPRRVARLFIRFFFVVEIKLTREVTFKKSVNTRKMYPCRLRIPYASLGLFR